MTADNFDDDENVKAMRETADAVGLTDTLIRALNSKQASRVKELIRDALRLLGAIDEVRS